MDHHSFGTLDTKQLDDELDGDDDLENEEERRQEVRRRGISTSVHVLILYFS